MRSKTIPLLFVLSMAAVAPRAALAGPPFPNETSQQSVEADALFHKGAAAFDAGKTEQAYQLFLAAWKLKQTHDIAGNLAQSEIKLGKTRDAAEHIAFALAHFPPSVAAQTDRIEKMKRALDGLKKSLGTLRLRVAVAGARVAIDGVTVGEAPLAGDVFVEPGPHVLEASAEGFERVEVRVSAARGATQDVELVLVASPPAPPAAPPPTLVEAASGPRRELLIAGGATAGAALLAGVVFAIVSAGKASDAAAQREEIMKLGPAGACDLMPSTRCQDLHGAMRGQATFGNLAAWSFIAAGVVGAGTAIYAIAARNPAAKTSWQLAPVVGTATGGLMVRGEW